MPNNTIKSFAKRTNKSVAAVEKLWQKAKAIAKNEGQANNYAYITGILKNMLKIEKILKEDAPPVDTNNTLNSSDPKTKLLQIGFDEQTAATLMHLNVKIDAIEKLINDGWQAVSIKTGLDTIKPLLESGWKIDQIKKFLGIF